MCVYVGVCMSLFAHAYLGVCVGPYHWRCINISVTKGGDEGKVSGGVVGKGWEEGMKNPLPVSYLL